MRILFDQSTPSPLSTPLKEHSVSEAREHGWDQLANGELLNAAEAAGYEIFITADKNLRYQQNLANRTIAIVVLGNARWRVLRLYVDRVVAAVEAATQGSYTVVETPFILIPEPE